MFVTAEIWAPFDLSFLQSWCGSTTILLIKVSHFHRIGLFLGIDIGMNLCHVNNEFLHASFVFFKGKYATEAASEYKPLRNKQNKQINKQSIC